MRKLKKIHILISYLSFEEIAIEMSAFSQNVIDVQGNQPLVFKVPKINI